jgi:hypothetical protein
VPQRSSQSPNNATGRVGYIQVNLLAPNFEVPAGALIVVLMVRAVPKIVAPSTARDLIS